MKTKALFIATACCALAVPAFQAKAQDAVVVEEETAVVTDVSCKTHYSVSKYDNWFIQFGAGVAVPFVEGVNDKGDRERHFTVNYNFAFGKWFSPYMGFRASFYGGPLHYETRGHMSKFNYVNANVDFMWDMFNSLGGVNPNRVFSIIPFVGVGGDANWDFKNHFNEQPAATNITREYSMRDPKSVQWTLPVSAGIQFRFRLCKYVDFFAEARATFYADNWNNVATGSSIESLVSAMGGFNFNIGGRGWNTFNECNYVSQIAALNGQVNDLRAQLLACGQTVAELQSQLPCPEVVQKDCVNAPLMATVRFTINSDKILPTEEVNIYSMAEWLKANPNEKIVIAGYADKDTGTSEYNMELSQRRAEVVKNALINTYGISADRLETKAFGSDVQEYPSHNDWNRIVIFKQ